MKMKPQDGYITYIINPVSGATSGRVKSQKFIEYLVEKGFDVRVRTTAFLEEACEFATKAAVDFDCLLVVVVGGDGTVREVMHGLEGSDKPMLIIPTGTENLLANELGLDESIEKTIEVFEGGMTRLLDLGSANGKSFTSIVGFGFDGRVVSRVSSQRKGHIHYFDYFWPIWRTFWGYRFEAVTVEVDGEKIFDGEGLVFVGNISRYALGLRILHEADCGDGLLDVCVYECSSKLGLLKHSVMTMLKLYRGRGDMIYRKGTKITVSSSSAEMQTEIDGDPGPSLPVKIEVIPQAVNCLVPENPKPAGFLKRVARALK